MGSPTKETHVLQLILENSPLKEWHFQEIVREAQVTKLVASKWLKKYVSLGVLEHKKPKGRFPFFTAGAHNSAYSALKRAYALQQLHDCGLLTALLIHPHAKTVLLFGSMITGDWYKHSDVDIFVLGDLSGFNKKKYESRLKRSLELHVFRDKQELYSVQNGLLKNILHGYLLKGDLNDLLEVFHETYC